MIESAMLSPSLWRRSISCWLGASSWKLYSTGMPMASSVRMVCLRIEPEMSLVVRSKKPASSSGSGAWPRCGGAK
ncbi:unannotated protein [freshwater metagenome]|uniref:Unannotated protein n=1 Tax=freshwater metagenome TaxID=449393 RepID=A0A6J6YDH5_9ZZZZ